MEPPKIKTPVLEHRGLKSKYCKTDSNTALFKGMFFWARQARNECLRLQNSKDTSKKTRNHIQLIISFLDTFIILITHWGTGK